jgi:hypothetical protein
MDERRRHPRRRSLLGAQIVDQGLSMVLDCTARNVSDGGALLAVDPAVPIPDQFLFVLRHGDPRVPARLVWRRGDRAGVAFAA